MLKIVYQGVAGAYSHIAAQNIYPGQTYLPCETFEQAMDMVQKNLADLAVIPVENSNAGRVADVHFLLPETGLFINGEYFLRVEHQLLGLPGSRLEEVVSASSHPQALAQCSVFLKQHKISAVARIDTAKSCQDILNFQDKSKAAIASKLAAEIYGLEILKSNIENDCGKFTRFLLMSRDDQTPPDDGSRFITSCIFRVKSIPAALYKALGGFATNGINLTKLESYQVDGRFVSARFYMEIESHPDRPSFQNAFDELRFFADELHILGTYAAGRFREKQQHD